MLPGRMRTLCPGLTTPWILSEILSTLDLYPGYWQVEMDMVDMDAIAFVTRQGLYRFMGVPFGLCNAPAMFEWLMESVLKELIWGVCLIYLDAIIVYGTDFYWSMDWLKLGGPRCRN